MSSDKYTLSESALVFTLAFLLICLTAIAMLPLLLLTAWMRETVWNWYCAAVHLPPVSIWFMFVVGLFVSMFLPSYPTLKDDLLKFKSWQNSLFSFTGQVIVFVIIAIVHIWFKG